MSLKGRTTIKQNCCSFNNKNKNTLRKVPLCLMKAWKNSIFISLGKGATHLIMRRLEAKRRRCWRWKWKRKIFFYANDDGSFEEREVSSDFCWYILKRSVERKEKVLSICLELSLILSKLMLTSKRRKWGIFLSFFIMGIRVDIQYKRKRRKKLNQDWRLSMEVFRDMRQTIFAFRLIKIFYVYN